MQQAKAQRLSFTTPWYYGWNIVLAGALLQGVTFGIGYSCFAYMVPGWIGDFGVSRAEAQTAIMAVTLAIGVLSPLGGRILDSLPIHLLVTIGSACFVGGLLLISIATALWQIIVIYAVMLALGMTLAGPLATSTLAAKWFRGRRGLALGLVSTGTSIGGMVFPPIATTLLALEGGWREAHVTLAMIAAATLLPLAWFVIRSSPEEVGLEPDPDTARSRAVAASFDGHTWTVPQILTSRALWITVAAFLPLNLVLAGVQNNLALFAGDLGIGLQEAGRLVPVISGAMLVGKLTFGPLADRIDNRLLFWVAAACFIASLALMRSVPGYGTLLVACGLMGFGMGANLPLLGSIVASRFGPQAFGRVSGILFMFTTLSAFGAVIGGYLRDLTGDYGLMQLAFILLMVPAAIAMAFLPKPK